MGAILYLADDRYLGPVSGHQRTILGTTSAEVHEAWLQVDDGKRTRAVVKVYAPSADGRETRELLNELIGHHLAAAWQMPVPARAGIIVLRRSHTGELSFWSRLPPEASEVAAWWTEAVDVKSVKARYNIEALQARLHFHKGPLAAIREELRQAPTLPGIVAFDEIVANVDRNLGNLLGPVGERYLLIDHGRCLTGPLWRRADLNPNHRFTNVLRDFVDWDSLPLATRNKAVAVFDGIQPRVKSALDSIEQELSGILEPNDLAAVIAFLAARARRDTAGARMGLIV